jgi:superfamily II DNA helicase RecQ
LVNFCILCEKKLVIKIGENILPQTSDKFSTQKLKSQTEKIVPESVVLIPKQELKFTALKNWRNERAASDGVPPYLIAQNDSLLQITAADRIETAEDLMNIKGFGEKAPRNTARKFCIFYLNKSVV